MLALAFSIRLCQGLGGAVLPPFYWNTGQCHDSPCTCHVPEDLYRPALISVCMGLRSFPAKVLVIVNGHGGKCQRESPRAIAERLNACGYPLRVIEAYPYTHMATADVAGGSRQYGRNERGDGDDPGGGASRLSCRADICTGEIPFVERGTLTAQRGRRVWDAYLQEATEAIRQALVLTDA